MWVEPIYDRTSADITTKTAKAYCNYTDLQRLEDNCEYLSDLFGLTITTKTWNRTDFPTVSDLSRIRSNIATLRTVYYTRSTTPTNPDNPLNTYQKWNAAEQILNDIYELYNENLSAYFYASEAYSGELTGVI